jgi:1,4-dihydroxy-2-naphthoyl-CoA hydrolase
MFLTYNKVRMHDTDMAGILYFPRQFRFAHDALEDFIESYGLSFDRIFRKEKFVFVIVHAEADYLAPLKVGDDLEVQVVVEKIGTTSFTIGYKIFKKDKSLVGTAKTIHVTLDATTRKKMQIPEDLKEFLKLHEL